MSDHSIRESVLLLGAAGDPRVTRLAALLAPHCSVGSIPIGPATDDDAPRAAGASDLEMVRAALSTHGGAHVVLVPPSTISASALGGDARIDWQRVFAALGQWAALGCALIAPETAAPCVHFCLGRAAFEPDPAMPDVSALQAGLLVLARQAEAEADPSLTIGVLQVDDAPTAAGPSSDEGRSILQILRASHVPNTRIRVAQIAAEPLTSTL